HGQRHDGRWLDGGHTGTGPDRSPGHLHRRHGRPHPVRLYVASADFGVHAGCRNEPRHGRPGHTAHRRTRIEGRTVLLYPFPDPTPIRGLSAIVPKKSPTAGRRLVMPTIYLARDPQAHALYFGDAALSRLQRLGTVLRHSGDGEPSPEQLLESAQDCDIIVAFRIPAIPAQVLDRLPRLAAVCRVAVDVRNIDVAAASRNGILVTQATPGFGPSVAEWAIGAMLALARGLCDYNASYHQGGEPVAAMGRELGHSTLGIIGYGTIGQYLSRLALAFGMKVL